eukprot:CAMPEP_0202844462 /NCGR_PEP_ID=MMETSP1389-20130828/67366_1 /ASSEMBLY_ACC=CAM_ASM_000865 /TAXON_ID=302021 /ORGANISM="Rhodomonas sp., Strain CCMP768" /LENGTH=37 /DNA_ID= /DNA_START= /DNA_END= /DNA_ORIENTATION=
MPSMDSRAISSPFGYEHHSWSGFHAGAPRRQNVWETS